MCGIAGYFGNFDETLLGRMNDVIAHRGPDGDGLFVDAESGVGLAHRRLSIIDLSDAGKQPMVDDRNRAVMVFNGEIYNYRELRRELSQQGVQFRGHSDSEVLLQLYLRDGVEILSRLNGIFAFAIWDVRKRELFIARDGVGVKPLYYAASPRGVLFASELKALLQESTVSREIDPVALSQYLTYMWCPSPRTLLRDVHKLEPGHAMILRESKVVRRWSFYDLPYGVKRADLSDEDAVVAVRLAVDQAVERQMVADVPVGAFLSGGLDSSALVALAKRHSADTLQCFTIGFKGKGAQVEGMVEDLPYAQKVATHLGVDLHTVTVGPEMADHLEQMIYFLDEPQSDPAPLNALFICKLAREHGIKVLLSGAGGDDIFTGYRRHWALQQERYWAWLPQPVRQGIAGIAQRLPTDLPTARRLRKAFEYAGLEDGQRLASYFYWLSPDRVQSLLVPELRASVSDGSIVAPMIEAMSRLPDRVTKLDRMLYLEGKYFLADHNLNYTDKMSMAHGVEVRVPFLDPDLIALAASLPDGMKQRGRTGKWILKQAMEPYLPRDVIYRPKTGFGVPLRHWLRHELRPMIDDILSTGSLARRGLFDADGVANLLKMDRKGQIDATYPIFAMVCVELWCRVFLDRPVPAGSSLGAA